MTSAGSSRGVSDKRPNTIDPDGALKKHHSLPTVPFVHVWYLLMQPGRRIPASAATKLTLDPIEADVDHFRSKVFQMHFASTPHFSPNRLSVFRKVEDVASGDFLASELKINGLGGSSQEALIVIISDGIPPITIPNMPPDSTRLLTHLPPNEDIARRDLYFVNRDETMKALLELHFDHYALRNKPNAGGDMLRFPLMDSLFGMGKSTFANKYLALVEKFAQSLGNETHALDLKGGGYSFARNCRLAFQSSASETEKDATDLVIKMRGEIPLIRSFFDEMNHCRTLYLKFYAGTLFDQETRDATLRAAFQVSLRSWGITLPDHTKSFYEIIEFIPKPVFIAFDEIGQAFDKPNTGLEEQRGRFFDFVQACCTYLLDTHQVYYLLCGRSKFLWDVGLRPEEFQDDDDRKRRSSPGEFVRINLNPIREQYIELILEHTRNLQGVYLNTALCQQYPEKPLTQIMKELYALTGGHPRTLVRCLSTSDPLAGAPHVGLMIDEVRLAVEKYPSAILNMVKDALENRVFNLSEETIINGKQVSKGYSASRLHAGYEANYGATPLYISPPILNYILWSSFEYAEYLKAYCRTLKTQYVNKARVFEEIFIKWLQARCRDRADTFKQVMDEFCPEESILAKLQCRLDKHKVKKGQQILAEASSDNGNTVSIEQFANEISGYLKNQEVHIYFPAQRSQSPDILIMPPIEGMNKILIGVQAKCVAPMSRIQRHEVKAELEKLKIILDEVRKDSGCENTKGVFVMYASCTYSSEILSNERTASTVWHGLGDDIEIIILNLGTVDLRKKFFSLPIPTSESGSSEIVIKAVEDLIKS